jgi:cobalamin biosynthesis protein CbiD
LLADDTEKVMTPPTPLGPAGRLARLNAGAAALALAVGLSACTHTVRIETPEPIQINLNVKIEQEVVLRLDREVQDLVRSKPNLF